LRPSNVKEAEDIEDDVKIVGRSAKEGQKRSSVGHLTILGKPT
jgi:hypothetical protein